jgi:hypothetical protein
MDGMNNEHGISGEDLVEAYEGGFESIYNVEVEDESNDLNESTLTRLMTPTM